MAWRDSEDEFVGRSDIDFFSSSLQGLFSSPATEFCSTIHAANGLHPLEPRCFRLFRRGTIFPTGYLPNERPRNQIQSPPAIPAVLSPTSTYSTSHPFSSIVSPLYPTICHVFFIASPSCFFNPALVLPPGRSRRSPFVVVAVVHPRRAAQLNTPKTGLLGCRKSGICDERAPPWKGCPQLSVIIAEVSVSKISNILRWSSSGLPHAPCLLAY